MIIKTKPVVIFIQKIKTMKSVFGIILLFSTVILFAFNSNINSSKVEIRKDLKRFYDQNGVTGSFMLYDQSKDELSIYNEEQTKVPFTPASTFKIFNSLVGLETGVVKDENFEISWDGVTRNNVEWNKDQDLTAAFKNSTVWYFQEVARRVGGSKMKSWLDKVNYGNADTTGGIDSFWLTGGLKISPEQQLDFLKKLHDNKLPFSVSATNTTKKIMIDPTVSDYILRAKTGWGVENGTNIGWYIGYIEMKKKVYYFVNCIQTKDANNMKFSGARKEIVFQILKKLEITK